MKAWLRFAFVAYLWLAAFFPAGGNPGAMPFPRASWSFQGTGIERSRSLEEAHESNGPGGSVGVPMQRLPPVQIGLALGVLLGAAGWFALATRQKRD